MTQTQQTVLALAIYTIWITLLYIRIFDKTLKKICIINRCAIRILDGSKNA